MYPVRNVVFKHNGQWHAHVQYRHTWAPIGIFGTWRRAIDAVLEPFRKGE